MASSSSSKAPSLPEWRRNLLAVDPAKRCGSQTALIRSLELWDKMVADLKQSSLKSSDSTERLLTFFSSNVEIDALALGDFLVFQLDTEAMDLVVRATDDTNSEIVMDFVSKYGDTPQPFIASSEMPQVLLSVVASVEYYGKMACLVILSEAKLMSCPTTERSGKAIAHLAPVWHNFQPYWAQLKRLGGDNLLKKIGSELTIDQLEAWSKCLMAVGCICNVINSGPNPQNLTSLVEILKTWLTAYDAMPEELKHLSEITEKVYLHTLELMYDQRSSASWDFEIVAKNLIAFASPIFARATEHALNAVPRDPVRIAQKLIEDIDFCIMTHGLAGLMNPKDNGKRIKQGKKGLEEAKEWLPPYCYKVMKAKLTVQSQQHSETNGDYKKTAEYHKTQRLRRERGEVPTEPASLKSLRSSCANCKSSGRSNNLQLCGQCKQVYYCSVACQKADWKRHKKECKSHAGTEQ